MYGEQISMVIVVTDVDPLSVSLWLENLQMVVTTFGCVVYSSFCTGFLLYYSCSGMVTKVTIHCPRMIKLLMKLIRE